MSKIGIELHKKTYEELQQTVTELVLEKRKLEKALDKACVLLADSATHSTKDDWKRLLMDDEVLKHD